MSMAIGVHVYYLPFYFQSVLGTSAAQSGIRILPYLMTLLLVPMLSGSLIALVGYYVPLLWIGCTLCTIGSGLLFSLKVTSSEAQWVGYQFLAAFGAGLCRQIAFSAVPLVLPPDDLATASALVAFCNSLGPTLAIGIGQSIFTNELVQRLGSVPGIDVQLIVNAGAGNLAAVVPAHLLESVRVSFDFAVTRALALAIPSAGLALCSSLAMEWISVKKK
jgi:MFS family permease